MTTVPGVCSGLRLTGYCPKIATVRRQPSFALLILFVALAPCHSRPLQPPMVLSSPPLLVEKAACHSSDGLPVRMHAQCCPHHRRRSNLPWWGIQQYCPPVSYIATLKWQQIAAYGYADIDLGDDAAPGSRW